MTEKVKSLKEYFSEVLPDVKSILKIDPLSLKGYNLVTFENYGYTSIYTCVIQEKDTIAIVDSLLIYVSDTNILIESSLKKDSVFYSPKEELIINLLSKVKE